MDSLTPSRNGNGVVHSKVYREYRISNREHSIYVRTTAKGYVKAGTARFAMNFVGQPVGALEKWMRFICSTPKEVEVVLLERS